MAFEITTSGGKILEEKAFLTNRPCIIGHRGAAGLAPENTLPSFAKALECGVNAVELDVYNVEDTLIVIHDDTLERTTNGRGPVMQQRLAGLRSLDAGNGAGIPTLDEVWTLIDGKAGLNIELKGPDTALPVARWLERTRPPANSIMVSSFDHGELARFKDHDPDGPDASTIIAPLFHKWRSDIPSVAARFQTGWVNINQRVLNPERVSALTQANLTISSYTVNSTRRAQALLRMGVQALFTDYPDRLSRLSPGDRSPAPSRSADR